MNHQSNNANKVKKVNPTELTNGYANGHVDNHDRGRTRGKKEEKANSEYMEHIETTLKSLKNDLDRISSTVRTLEERTSQLQAVRDLILAFKINSFYPTASPEIH